MTELEITKLCAEAMIGPDYVIDMDIGGSGQIYHISGRRPYDPLHDDAQAMALVKRFNLRWSPLFDGDKQDGWCVATPDGLFGDTRTTQCANDLNRAICETVAKMEKAKK